jgi:uncharacterized protein (TIGR00730 family)
MAKNSFKANSGTWPIKAYKNLEFLNSPDARTIRILCEFIEPEARFRHFRIRNTIVFFGSTRVVPHDVAEQNLKQLESKLSTGKEPAEALAAKIELAQRAVIMSRYYEDAALLSEKLTRWSLSIEDVKRRFYICSGGGPGIMEAANRGAHNAGGPSIGLNISIPLEQAPNPYMTKELSFEFHYFFIRKFWFFYLGKALVVFPGGFGTMDELFELLTIVQTHKSKKYMPIILYGTKYWNELINFNAMIKWGTISEQDMKLFHFFDNVDSAFEFLRDELTQHYLSESSGNKKQKANAFL